MGLFLFTFAKITYHIMKNKGGNQNVICYDDT